MNLLGKVFITEFFCMFLLLFFGFGSGFIKISYNRLFVSMSWGIAIFISSVIGHIFGGAKSNPVLSLISFFFDGQTLSQTFMQIMGQILGGIIATVIIISIFEKNKNMSIEKFIAYNKTSSTNEFVNFVLEITGTFFMIFFIRNISPTFNKQYLILFINSFFIAILIYSFGRYSGASFNPSRDLVPRLTYFAWRRKNLGSARKNIFSSNLGPIVGGLLYYLIMKK